MFRNLILFTFLLYSAVPGYSQQYYRSNSIGMPLEKLGKYRSEMLTSEYILEISRSGSSEKRVLLKNGEIIKKWEIVLNSFGEVVKEIFYEGERKTVTNYRSGHILDKEEYSGGELEGRSRYIYTAAGRMSSIEEYDSSGSLILKREYINPESGRISRIGTESASDNREDISSYSFSGTDVRYEWQGNSEGTGRYFYYSSGRVVYMEKWSLNSLVSRTDYFYDDDVLEQTVERIFSGNIEILKNYDEKRRVVSETEKKGDEIFRKVHNTYDGENISKKVVSSDSGTEKYLYNYSDDKLSSELYYFNGSLRKKTVYQEGDGNYFEDLYSENVKYMRIYYKDSEKYKTER